MGYVNKTYLSTQFKNFADKIAKVFSKIGHKHVKSDITDFPTSMPANGGNAATVGGHTVGVNVPSNAKFTDTNTWRPVVNNLTSTATDSSLSANQGKILNDKISNLPKEADTIISSSGTKMTLVNESPPAVNRLPDKILYIDGTEIRMANMTNSPNFSSTDKAIKFTPLGGVSNKITDCMNISKDINYNTESNWDGFVAAEDASKITNSPISSGAFYAYRKVLKTPSVDGSGNIRSGAKIMVLLYEMYPSPGRIWTRVYNTDSGWSASWQSLGSGGVTFGTTAGTACEGNDSRLSNARPASDVYSWAKASNKPSYSASEVGALSTGGGTVSGNVNISGILSTANSKVSLWSDTEGGNIQISSPNGVSYQADAYNDNFRLYWYDASGTIHDITIGRNGKVYIPNVNNDLASKLSSYDSSITTLTTGHSSLNAWKVGTTSNTTFYKVTNLNTFRDSNNAYLAGEKGNYVFSISAFSDKRLKKNILNSNVNALDKINQIKYHSFDFKDESYGSHEDIGYIADELKEVFPECVVSVPQDKEKCGYDELLQVEDKGLIKYLGKGIQELSSIVNKQQEEIDKLKEEINKLKED